MLQYAKILNTNPLNTSREFNKYASIYRNSISIVRLPGRVVELEPS